MVLGCLHVGAHGGQAQELGPDLRLPRGGVIRCRSGARRLLRRGVIPEEQRHHIRDDAHMHQQLLQSGVPSHLVDALQSRIHSGRRPGQMGGPHDVPHQHLAVGEFSACCCEGCHASKSAQAVCCDGGSRHVRQYIQWQHSDAAHEQCAQGSHSAGAGQLLAVERTGDARQPAQLHSRLQLRGSIGPKEVRAASALWQSYGVQKHGVPRILEGRQHLWVAGKQNALRLQQQQHDGGAGALAACRPGLQALEGLAHRHKLVPPGGVFVGVVLAGGGTVSGL
mmetsp:Transcript_18066/g.54381  ORF Transcript_18066/g.54381 Transcript_18066/m.54381 type:complete len:280 (+) Transcript_18066:1240-2079(+)